ncbi:MAG: HipA domain-containing protein [Sphaerochaetaceae bacterium]|nr:HipA domain-containing protein [Sphaerochaetaceae bacterium]
MVKKLYVAMNNIIVGEWEKKNSGEETFQYLSSWLNYSHARSLSLSMPMRKDKYTNDIVENFFSNLLPEKKEILEALQRKFQIKKSDSFSLLSKIGKDCIGAIQIAEDPSFLQINNGINGNTLTEKEIGNLIRDTKTGNFNYNSEPYKISLSGSQSKIALLYDNGEWKETIGTTPTTHIFKLPIGVTPGGLDLSDSIENEWYCNNFFTTMNLPVPESKILYFDGEKILAVKRFDRAISKDKKIITRLPQEDFCQILNIPYYLKYQNDGGPSPKDIVNILRGSSNKEDSLTFFKALMLNWLISATDAHAKNYSIFIGKNDSFKLTPFYDIMSFSPYLGKGKNKVHESKIKLAMAVKGTSNKNKYKIEQIQKYHWDITSKDLNISNIKYKNLLEEIINNSELAIQKVNDNLPKNFPSYIAETITNDVIKHVNILKQS